MAKTKYFIVFYFNSAYWTDNVGFWIQIMKIGVCDKDVRLKFYENHCFYERLLKLIFSIFKVLKFKRGSESGS